MRYHQYAEDIQIYISLPGDPSDVTATFSTCLEAVDEWGTTDFS